jgi:hypothetical protein
VILNGGTFDTGGNSEPGTVGQTIGPLTLQSSSTIDLGNGASKLNFADSKSQSWSGTLSILNWTGTQGVGNGVDQLLFGTSATTPGVTANQLLEIQFVNPNGVAGTYSAMYNPTNMAEVIPSLVAVPEPGTWAAGALILVSLVMSRRNWPRWISRPDGRG